MTPKNTLSDTSPEALVRHHRDRITSLDANHVALTAEIDNATREGRALSARVADNEAGAIEEHAAVNRAIAALRLRQDATTNAIAEARDHLRSAEAAAAAAEAAARVARATETMELGRADAEKADRLAVELAATLASIRQRVVALRVDSPALADRIARRLPGQTLAALANGGLDASAGLPHLNAGARAPLAALFGAQVLPEAATPAEAA